MKKTRMFVLLFGLLITAYACELTPNEEIQPRDQTTAEFSGGEDIDPKPKDNPPPPPKNKN